MPLGCRTLKPKTFGPYGHYGCVSYGDLDGSPTLLPLKGLHLSLKLILVPCVVPLVPCVVRLVPCVVPLVPCAVPLVPYAVPLVPCVVTLVYI